MFEVQLGLESVDNLDPARRSYQNIGIAIPVKVPDQDDIGKPERLICASVAWCGEWRER